MRKARIHMYFTTMALPNRKLSDIEYAHDAIDLDIGDNERVVQCDLVETAFYRQATTTRPHAAQGMFMHTAEGKEVAGRERTVNVRDKSMSVFRCRVTTIEELDAVDAEDFSEQHALTDGGTVYEADVVEEIQP